jgi:hypothetical protein
VSDNTPQNGTAIVTADEVTYSGDITQTQLVQLAFVTGAEGSRSLAKVPGDTTNGIDVDVTRNAPPQVSVIKTSVTRPADTNAYAANDVFANSTSAPTAGGYTFSNAARSSGGGGTITGAIISMSASSAFQGEIWIFDQATTAKNDNAAFDVSDTDILNVVGVIPFNVVDTTSSNAISYVEDLNIDFVCVGSADLRFLIKVMAIFTPASSEKLAIQLKVRN